MPRDICRLDLDVVSRQSAQVLLTTTLEFLRRNNIPRDSILDCVRQSYGTNRVRANVRQYRSLIKAYEEMGIVMSTWFSSPKFLDSECRPQALSTGRGSLSISNLLKMSRVSISATKAAELLRRSPSIKVDQTGKLIALRSVFVLPDFEIPRAALVIERYLDTLQRNTSRKKNKTVLLLERNCHVPEVSLKTIAPILRDIKGRGSAFINSVNGDIEGKRLRKSGTKGAGEMSVHIFAWTRPKRVRRLATHSRANS
jgi:hypothetical protein